MPSISSLDFEPQACPSQGQSPFAGTAATTHLSAISRIPSPPLPIRSALDTTAPNRHAKSFTTPPEEHHALLVHLCISVVTRKLRRRRRQTRGRDRRSPAPALSHHPRQADRLHLRRRPLHRAV